jgi:hypothetical protein
MWARRAVFVRPNIFVSRMLRDSLRCRLLALAASGPIFNGWMDNLGQVRLASAMRMAGYVAVAQR